jgi:hypothetical protein
VLCLLVRPSPLLCCVCVIGLRVRCGGLDPFCVLTIRSEHTYVHRPNGRFSFKQSSDSRRSLASCCSPLPSLLLSGGGNVRMNGRSAHQRNGQRHLCGCQQIVKEVDLQHRSPQRHPLRQRVRRRLRGRCGGHCAGRRARRPGRRLASGRNAGADSGRQEKQSDSRAAPLRTRRNRRITANAHTSDGSRGTTRAMSDEQAHKTERQTEVCAAVRTE